MRKKLGLFVAAFLIAPAVFFTNVTSAWAISSHWSSWKNCASIGSGWTDDWQFRVYWLAYTSTKWKPHKLQTRSTGGDVKDIDFIRTAWFNTSTAPDTRITTRDFDTGLRKGADFDGSPFSNFEISPIGSYYTAVPDPWPMLQVVPFSPQGDVICNGVAIYETT